ncbi:VOC family protein [Emticicia fluvialis]|uniref:VOC family protein n=1 Tax=Emticicia fluvialis TaxID=2974474 RepID=UPI00216676B8|nr:VOC family protein [Emticicia fluvialis]
MEKEQKITPFLWFNGNIAEAIELYTSVFKNTKVHYTNKVGDKIMNAKFELEGQVLLALDGGPHFAFTPAISMFIDCKTQEEIDYYWDNLIANGGKPSRCGWLVDKFGLSWQVVPDVLGQLLGDPDPAKAQRAMNAMLKMDKLDIEALKKAHAGI